jgi:hypothetical protein
VARFNTVQIETLYLTETGLSGGIPCKVEVSGLEALMLAYSGSVAIAADGTPYSFVQSNAEAQGSPIAILIEHLTTGVLSSLKTLFNAAIGGGTTLTVVINGDLGNFSLECQPLFPKPIDPSGKFRNGRIFGLTLNLIVQSVN